MSNNGLAFIEFFDNLVEQTHSNIPEDVQDYYSMIKSSVGATSSSKQGFTEIGLQILEYLQNCEIKNLKARDIAEGMNIPSRKISGAMRKLVSDGFVDKFGQNPTVYSITNQGKEIDITKYKENNKNED